MAQHHYVIANDDGASVCAEWSDVLATIKSTLVPSKARTSVKEVPKPYACSAFS